MTQEETMIRQTIVELVVSTKRRDEWNSGVWPMPSCAIEFFYVFNVN